MALVDAVQAGSTRQQSRAFFSPELFEELKGTGA